MSVSACCRYKGGVTGLYGVVVLQVAEVETQLNSVWVDGHTTTFDVDQSYKHVKIMTTGRVPEDPLRVKQRHCIGCTLRQEMLHFERCAARKRTIYRRRPRRPPCDVR